MPLNGRVTGVVEGTPTNRPVDGAKVEIYKISAETGERQGAALLSRTTGADGVWGPLATDSATPLEFVVVRSDGERIFQPLDIVSENSVS